MRKGKITFLTLLYVFSLLLTLHSKNCLGQSAYDLTRRMFAETKKITSLKFTMNKQERIEGKMLEQVSEVKLSLEPFKVYIKQISPKDGLEILYCEGKYNNKALINPSGFPWMTLKLNPRGSLMRKNQHHTIFNSGYDHVVSILEYLLDKYSEAAKTMVKKLEPVSWDGNACYAIEFNDPYFKYVNHRVKKGETLLTIADSLKLSEYMILEKNGSVDDYDDVKPGQIIQIPNDYSPKMLLYIDKIRFIPLMMKIYDDQGLYEIYEYYDVTVNPVFKPEAFSSKNKAYDF